MKVDHAARFKQQAPEKPDQESKLPIDGILQKDHHTKDHPYVCEIVLVLHKIELLVTIHAENRAARTSREVGISSHAVGDSWQYRDPGLA